MEYLLKEEIISRLEQIIESIDVLLERNKDIIYHLIFNPPAYTLSGDFFILLSPAVL